jgi:sulfate transport system substrate-binding protein
MVWARLRKVFFTDWRQTATWLMAVVMLALVAGYGWRTLFVKATGPVTLVVYAFSTQEEVLTQRIFPGFEQAWEAETGRDVTIAAVFGPSGTLAGQINLGAPADVVILSSEQHINWLKIGRRVQSHTRPVVVSQTPMVIVVRPGNPANIADFADLTRPGLALVHANPRSSGAGDWAVLAEYGSKLLETNSTAAAQGQLEDIWHNVRLMAPSARAALTLFELGAGDALVTYEQDARLALDRGVKLEIVTPPQTMLAQHVAVMIDSNLTRLEEPAARALVNYLSGEAGQQAMAHYHLRPVIRPAAGFPALGHTFTVTDLGGWPNAYVGVIENLWQQAIEPRINLESTINLLPAKGE